MDTNPHYPPVLGGAHWTLTPDLGYEDLDVQDGASAMEAWERMIGAEAEEADRISRALLSYCERDTFAMVEIYRFLTELCQSEV